MISNASRLATKQLLKDQKKKKKPIKKGGRRISDNRGKYGSLYILQHDLIILHLLNIAYIQSHFHQRMESPLSWRKFFCINFTCIVPIHYLPYVRKIVWSCIFVLQHGVNKVSKSWQPQNQKEKRKLTITKKPHVAQFKDKSSPVSSMRAPKHQYQAMELKLVL